MKTKERIKRNQQIKEMFYKLISEGELKCDAYDYLSKRFGLVVVQIMRIIKDKSK